jgi:hypothetical protein
MAKIAIRSECHFECHRFAGRRQPAKFSEGQRESATGRQRLPRAVLAPSA